MQKAWALVALIALAIWVALLGQAQAQGTRNCAPREMVMEKLQGKYGETPRMIALGLNGAVVEVLAAAGGGTWTIVVTTPAGITCLIAAGTDFEALDGEPAAKGDDI
ncbi:MAG: hypothetical protein COC12_08440 [Rhodobacteraceae bacterium]|nr:MAG: hypothetical protein COC12_08440 [Paracoccaceae bacterium]